MKKSTLVCLIVAVSLVLAGCILFVGVLMALRWEFGGLISKSYETNEYAITEEYKNISILSDTADVVFLPSEEGNTSVVCYEQEKCKHAVAVKDGTLTVELVDTRKWYDHVTVFNLSTPKITVTLPKAAYDTLAVKNSTGDLTLPKELSFESIEVLLSTGDVYCASSATEAIKIKTTTGDIRLEDVSSRMVGLTVSTGKITATSVTCDEELSVTVSTGKAKLTDVQCAELRSVGNTGDLLMQNVIAGRKIFVERTTGDVTLERSDAREIVIRTDTGDVEGTLRSEKSFFADSDTGDVDVPQNQGNERCEIITDTGDIRIRIQQ